MHTHTHLCTYTHSLNNEHYDEKTTKPYCVKYAPPFFFPFSPHFKIKNKKETIDCKGISGDYMPPPLLTLKDE